MTTITLPRAVVEQALEALEQSERMAELAPHHARDVARTAMCYSQAFDGRKIDWHSDEPWPHRIELAQALDWITELGAMVLNLADRVEKAEGPNVPMSRARDTTAEARDAVAPRLDGRVKPL